MGYEWRSNFNEGIKKDGSDNLLYSADMFHCLLKNSSETIKNPGCYESSINSMYIDPNLEDDEWKPCQSGWIGDGECDDGCRTDECSYDDGDCELGINMHINSYISFSICCYSLLYLFNYKCMLLLSIIN